MKKREHANGRLAFYLFHISNEQHNLDIGADEKSRGLHVILAANARTARSL